MNVMRVPAISDAQRIGIAPRTVLILVAVQLLASAFELLGLVSFLPIFQFVNSGGRIDDLASQGGLWPPLIAVSELIGVTITLPKLLAVTFCILLFRQLLSFVCEYYEFSQRESAIARMRAKLFGAFIRASSEAQERASSGGMVQDMSYNSLRAAQHIFSRFALATQLSILFVYLVGMLLMNASVTLFLAGMIAISGLIAYPYLRKARRYGTDFVAANKRSSEFVIERLRLARLVRLNRMEGIEADAINRLSFVQRNVSISIWRTLAIVDALLETLAVSAALLFIYVATTFFGVAIDLVSLMIAMLLRLVPIVRQIARLKQFADGARASYDSVVERFEELDSAAEVYRKGAVLPRLKRGIEFKSVTCSYTTRRDSPALSDVSLFIPSGKTTAIVGPSGSGKSTLVDLLPRLREPDAGQILLDGRDARDFELGSLRAAIAFVSQAPVVFDVPVIEHIRYGAPDASREEAQDAARQAGAALFIEALPEGYDTPAGENGRLLSGGQRQRLDLARALLSKAQILVLDEPTTGLDAESAQLLMAAVERIRSVRATTIIIVTHDLSSIEGADQIVVLKDGRIDALGTHDTLKGQNGWYARVMNSQNELGQTAGGIR